jgi:hypothetical protein
VKRTFALLLAATVLVVAAVAARAVEAGRARTVRREAARSAEAGGMRASDALATHVRELKLEAQNAAANPRLVAALRGNADAATLQDLFRTEDWWEPYRSAFKVYAVAFDGDKLDVIEGMKTAELASDLLVREARERKEAVAEIVMGKGWPYAAAAADVEMPGRANPAVLLLAKPIDDGAVRKLAEKARGAVLLSDGTRAVIAAGAEPERELLKAAVGSETKGPIYESGDGTWAAAGSPLVPGLWLWTFASGAAAAHEAESTAAATTAAIWSVAGLLAIVCLFIGLRRKPAEGRGAVETTTGVIAPPEPLPPSGGAFRTRAGAGAGARRGREPRAGRDGDAPLRPAPAGDVGRRPHHQLRPLHAARPPRRRGDGPGVHGGDVRRGGLPPHLRGQAPARRAVPRARRRRPVHRRGQPRLDARALEHHPGVRLREGR